jgi:tetratricopeptide (TPR) repeat protein
VGDVEGLALIYNNLGIVDRDQGEYDLAEQHFRQSLAVAEPFAMGYHIANSNIGLAQTLLLKGEIDAARSALQAAMDQAETIGADDLRAEIYRIQAEVLCVQAQWEEAHAVAVRSARMAAETGNRALEASVWRVIAGIELEQRSPGAARQAIEKAQQILPDATDELEAGRIAVQAGRIDLYEERAAEAQAHLRAAQRIFIRLGANPDLKRVEGILRRGSVRGVGMEAPLAGPEADGP